MVCDCKQGSTLFLRSVTKTSTALVFILIPRTTKNIVKLRVSAHRWYPVIIGNVRGARQMLLDPKWKADNQKEAPVGTSGGNNDDVDNHGGDMPSWMFKEESNRGKTKNRNSKKKPSQIKKNDNRATEDIKVLEETTEGKCVAGPVLTSAQAKKSDKNHPLKVKEAMSSVNKTTTKDLQKVSTLKKCFDRIGKPIIRENYVGELVLHEEWTTLSETSRDENRKKFKPVSCTKGTLTTSYVRESRISI